MTPEQMKKIVDGAPEWAFGYDIIDDEYFSGADIQDGYTIDHMEGCVCIDDLRTELAKREPMDLRDVDIPHGTIILEK